MTDDAQHLRELLHDVRSAAEVRIAELERENTELHKRMDRLNEIHASDIGALIASAAQVKSAIALAVSDMSALAGELELAGWPAPDVNQRAMHLGQRLRGIAATLDGAG
jgi:hypothetical protein